MGVRVAARGSGAGSLVNYAIGISGVDPLRHGLVVERFLSPLRQALPDIDIDVESARREEVYTQILTRYGGERCACVAMMDTYRVRHAVRDVGAALGMPPGEVDTIAKAFPHIRARDARNALRELPELRASGLAEARLSVLFDLVERLDGLPRHIALHPCGVLLSDATLLDRTPVEASHAGFSMSQFDKDDVEDLGLLKLDVLGIRMQSAMAHATAEIERVDGIVVDVDDQSQVPFDDPATYQLIGRAKTLGCFQIESPGQRELTGKFGPETFEDIIIDISLFRPGPVKSDMVTPFLQARQGWRESVYLHPALEPVLRPTCGVVVFHEQVLQIIEVMCGCTLAEADEYRRALGDHEGKEDVKAWFFPEALHRGFALPVVERVWQVLEAFASFGFCKAHAAAFALPTYQSAWLKTHHTAAFLAGVLTHDPGMYPKRLILDDARQFGIAVLGLDVNASGPTYTVERVGAGDEPPPRVLGEDPRVAPPAGLPDARCYGIRLSLADVKGISDAEVARVVAGRPYHSLTDFWHRARVSRPVAERLVIAGGFDSLYGIGSPVPVRRRGTVTRRDLLLQVLELDRWTRIAARGQGRPAQAQAVAGRRPRRRTGAGGRAVAAGAAARAAGGGAGRRPARARPRRRPRRDRADRPAGDDRGGAGPRRAGGAGARRQPARRRLLHPAARRARRHPLAASCWPSAAAARCWWPGSRSPPRHRRSGRGAGSSSSPSTTPPARSTRRSSRTPRGPTPPPSSTPGCWWCAVSCGGPDRAGCPCAPPGAGTSPPCPSCGGTRGSRRCTQHLAVVPEGFGTIVGEQAVHGAAESRSSRPVLAHPPRPTVQRRAGPGVLRRRHGPAPGAGARQRVPPVALLRHQAGRRRRQVGSQVGCQVARPRPAAEAAPRKLWHASPGSSGP